MFRKEQREPLRLTCLKLALDTYTNEIKTNPEYIYKRADEFYYFIVAGQTKFKNK